MKKIKCDAIFKDPYFTKINQPNCKADSKFIVIIDGINHFRCGRHSNKDNRKPIIEEIEKKVIKNVNIEYMINAITEHIKYGNKQSRDIIDLYNNFLNKILCE